MRYTVFPAIILLAAVVSGCERPKTGEAAAAPKASAPAPVLPSWAPADPSPEFRKAAAVLQPLPTEGASGKTAEMVDRLSKDLWPRAYEFFGTLSNRGIKQLRATGELRFSPRSLQAKQKAVLAKWVEAAEQVYNNSFLTSLGAATDLSNVQVGFQLRGQALAICLWVKPAHGSEVISPNYFALMP